MVFKFKDIIEEIKDFNSDLKYGLDDIVGVTIEKGLIPTIANLTQTSLDRFYIVKKDDFVYNPRTHGIRIGMGFNETNKTYITSWNNIAFRVKDKNIVIPKYLWIYFLRPEWDRQANYLAWGSSTIVFAWRDFLETTIELPSIEEQRRIVSEYQTVEARIKNNEALIQKLEETAQAIYHHTFVEGIDEENLPEGWSTLAAEDLFEISIGKTPPRECPEYFTLPNQGIKWVSIADMKKSIPFIFDTEEELTEEATEVNNIKVVDPFSILYSFKMTVGRVAITREKLCTNEAIANFKYNDRYYPYIYYFLKNINPIDLGNTSSITQAVNSKIIKNIRIIVPEKSMLEQFNDRVTHILEFQYCKQIENKHLRSLLSLLTSKLA